MAAARRERRTDPQAQDELAIDGWAMEARLYAENPVTGFLPSTGRLEQFALPDLGGQIRVDSAVEAGSEVSPFYDPMIAKLIAHGASRDGAASRLAAACDGVVTWPVRNNAGFLAALVRAPTVLAGAMDTGFIAANLDALLAGQEASEAVQAAAASLLFGDAGGSAAALDPQDAAPAPGQVWSDLIGFRLNADPDRAMWMSDGKETARAQIDAGAADVLAVVRRTGDGAVLIVDKGWPHRFELPSADQLAGGAGAAGDGVMLAPMPGKVIAVDVALGESVARGQRLLVLEAMKMEQALLAPFDGVVELLDALPGAQVAEGRILVRIGKAAVEQP
jgi:3-methylcrotonyl-CoA carboxylase alpha subunit